MSPVFSTLMVLLSKSELDMENLWTTVGAVNDPTGNKHEVDLAFAILDGNFRSALIDYWANQSFRSMYVQGTNKFGDILWETEFDVTGKSWQFSSCDQNYRFRIGPSGSTDTSWFAVSNAGLSFGPLPQMFVPRSPDVPFGLPVFIDGNLGCWNKDTLINVHLMFSNDTITPTDCIAACVGNASIAIITVKLNCFCSDVDPANPPNNDNSKCNLLCTSTQQNCGGFTDNYGSAYHVQGWYLPGYINTTSLFYKSYTTGLTTMEIDVSEISVASQVSPAFISNISVTAFPLDQYSVQYSTSNCSDQGGNMKDLSFDAVTTKMFKGDGRIESVDILTLRCLVIQLATVVPSVVRVQLWGPEVSSQHIEASALVIKGKSVIGPTSSTPTSSTTTTTTTTPTTTTSTSTSAANTMSSTTESTTATSLISTENNSPLLCYCHCTASGITLTEEQLKDRIDEIRRNLTVNVSNLSSRIRKLTSAEDKRVSAVSIGYVGVGILVVIFSAIVFIDSSLLHKDMRKLLDNIKNAACCKKKDTLIK
ncbi:uncharacterized protein LOC132760371 [Ruditapes philippinarum]|uniref:uncharacterized protein LOC132760371 n=1 Tax=Ruditapes philippinarum TaxID=129788 RepID=UPI00295A8E4C|nr:uncharacterized protein LOC132760371 [Ruditapes philippinarum]